MENTMTFLKIQKKILNVFYWKNRNKERAKQLREIVSTLSPAFIKLAQAFASRPDVVGEKAAKELQRFAEKTLQIKFTEPFDLSKNNYKVPSGQFEVWLND
jgi:predicted unusual protein kinase regulating ubiquinone biosynthesis (AarF/ABC1/UbiB family)